MGNSFDGMAGLPILRQAGLLVGLAATIALGVMVALWSQSTSYSMLFAGLDQRDAMAVMDSLQSAKIPYKLDEGSGAVMVASDQLHSARLHLAGQGLPNGGGKGFEMLNQDQGFGTSRFMETARFQRAMEAELARTISTIASVNSARVHLAIPKQSVFVRDRREPSASVMLSLYSGRSLDAAQVDAIINLVSGSVAELSPGNIKVIDQRGRLLSRGEGSEALAMTNDQFEYVRRIEDTYVKRIQDILIPVVGPEGLSAQVTAEVDFTVSESTSERYNPDLPALRSEQTSVEESRGARGAEGVPGALSNTPPEAGTLVEGETLNAAGASEGATSGPRNSSKRSTRNYELDKTIAHTKVAPGRLQRLSVAVVIDDKRQLDDTGTLQRTEVPIWQQDWVWNIATKVLGALLVLIVAFGVLRPVMRSLADRSNSTSMVPVGAEAAMAADGAQGQMPGAAPTVQIAGPSSYDQQLRAAQDMAAQDPKRVAQVMKSWINKES
jgi:flagellar M-ring protein FliF